MTVLYSKWLLRTGRSAERGSDVRLDKAASPEDNEKMDMFSAFRWFI
jgi:hypothetical protein